MSRELLIRCKYALEQLHYSGHKELELVDEITDELANPGPEPVAWMIRFKNGKVMVDPDRDHVLRIFEHNKHLLDSSTAIGLIPVDSLRG